MAFFLFRVGTMAVSNGLLRTNFRGVVRMGDLMSKTFIFIVGFLLALPCAWYALVYVATHVGPR